MKKQIVFLNIAILTLILVGPTGCSKKTGKESPSSGMKRSRIAFPVETKPVEVREVTYSLNAVGSIEAFEKVQITARLAGVVDRVLFSEGTVVASDQVLVEIEPERYRLAVESAQAAFEKARASKEDAEAGLKRREAVVEKTPGLIPTEELETWRTRSRVAAAEFAQAEAALNQAKLNLRDAYVRSPVPGNIETRTVQTGQYVSPGAVLATLVRRDPLLLKFQVPDSGAARLSKTMKVFFTVRNDKDEFTATIIHVGAAADEGTRMVSVIAEVTDPEKSKLRPGTFTQIRIPVEESRSMPVIPQTAIRPSEKGFIAYVAVDGVARERILTLGMRTAEGDVEVLDGLKPGEILVVRGAEALNDGYRVQEGRIESNDLAAEKDPAA